MTKLLFLCLSLPLALCELCDLKVQSCDHLFFSCTKTRDTLLDKFNISKPIRDGSTKLNTFISSCIGRSLQVIILKFLFPSSICIIQRCSNDLVFQQKHFCTSTIISRFVLVTQSRLEVSLPIFRFKLHQFLFASVFNLQDLLIIMDAHNDFQ